jgi:ABC-2 type transport system permease protein
MIPLFIKSIKDRWLFILVMCVISVLTLWMYVSLFPTVMKQSDEYEKLLSQFPKEVWEIFGIKGSSFSMSTLERFISVEMYTLLWPIMSIIMFVSFGVGIVASEIERGTIQILLSLPLSRVKMFISKYLAGAILILIFCAVSTLSIIPLARLYHIEYQAEVYYKVFIDAALFTICGYSVSALCSSFFERSRASAVATGLFLVMYIINIISTLKDNLSDLKYLSFFYYLDIPSVLLNNKLEGLSIAVFVAVSIACVITGIVHFNRRDISV